MQILPFDGLDDPAAHRRAARLRTNPGCQGHDPEDLDWDAFLPDDDEAQPEPGDFWIEDDDWENAA